MNIFESLENLNVSEECFKDILETVQEIINITCTSSASDKPSSAGDMGLIPDPGRYHLLWSNYFHVPQLLSLGFTAHSPQQDKSRK